MYLSLSITDLFQPYKQLWQPKITTRWRSYSNKSQNSNFEIYEKSRQIENFHDFFIAEGYLTVETLSSILLELEPDLSAEQLKEIIDEVDEDGSGTIDYDGNFEFYVAKMTPFNFLNFSEFMNMMMG